MQALRYLIAGTSEYMRSNPIYPQNLAKIIGQPCSSGVDFESASGTEANGRITCELDNTFLIQTIEKSRTAEPVEFWKKRTRESKWLGSLSVLTILIGGGYRAIQSRSPVLGTVVVIITAIAVGLIALHRFTKASTELKEWSTDFVELCRKQRITVMGDTNGCLVAFKEKLKGKIITSKELFSRWQVWCANYYQELEKRLRGKNITVEQIEEFFNHNPFDPDILTYVEISKTNEEFNKVKKTYNEQKEDWQKERRAISEKYRRERDNAGVNDSHPLRRASAETEHRIDSNENGQTNQTDNYFTRVIVGGLQEPISRIIEKAISRTGLDAYKQEK